MPAGDVESKPDEEEWTEGRREGERKRAGSDRLLVQVAGVQIVLHDNLTAVFH